MKTKRLFILALIGFLLGRAYILKFPPPFYSDVNHDYQRYANMWSYGYPPYLKHFYEYPPATIPLLYFPLFVDHLGIGQYYQNYRYMTFFLDLLIFVFILKTILKLKTKPLSKVLSLGFYLIGPVIAKDFFYEGIDLAFIGSLSIALISLLLLHQKKFFQRLLFWTFFWLSTSIKFMTAPLLVPYFYLKKLAAKQEIKAAILGFFLIWGLPLVIFRTSLSVMFVFHARRGLKYASFPSFIVETINYWTQTETRLNQPPDFQLQGPVSVIAEKIVAIIFPLSILLVLIYSLWVILKPNLKKLHSSLKQLLLIQTIKLNHLDLYTFSLKLALIYIFTIFLTGKVFSQPFHIWLIPLIALFPFRSLKRQLTFIILTIWLLIIDTTPWIAVDESIMVVEPLPMKFFLYLSRFLPMIFLLALSFKLPNKISKSHA